MHFNFMTFGHALAKVTLSQELKIWNFLNSSLVITIIQSGCQMPRSREVDFLNEYDNLTLSTPNVFSSHEPNLLFQNRWANFNQTWHKASVGEGGQSLFKWRAPPFSKWR